MQILSTILVALVALEHLYILYMEMFAWETLGKKTFKGSLPNELFKPTKKLAANQGLYNGFLAAGLTQITQLKFFEISLWGNPKFRRTIFCVFW